MVMSKTRCCLFLIALNQNLWPAMEWVGRCALRFSSRERCLKQLPELRRDIQRNLCYSEYFLLDMNISMWTRDKLF